MRHLAHGLASTEPHSLECGEPFQGHLSCHLSALASTEPHSLECGEGPASLHGQVSRHGFNGAALVGVRRGCPG